MLPGSLEENNKWTHIFHKTAVFFGKHDLSWFKPHRGHYVHPDSLDPKTRATGDFLTFRNIETWRDLRPFPPCFGVVLPGRGWIGENRCFFFQSQLIVDLKIWDIWDEIVISICLFIWFARILERCLRFMGMAQWWKDKKFKQYMKGPCFFLEPILLQHVALTRPEALREFRSFQKTCAGRAVFGSVDRACWWFPHGPQVINPKGWNCGNFCGGFGKVSEVFGLGALWSREREAHTTWAESCVFVVRFRVVFWWM